MSDAPPLGLRGTLLYVARRPLPTPWGDLVAHLCLECATRRWVLAVTAGDVGGRAPLLARLHSSCVTSESWGSRDCDCAEQLDAALAAIAGAGRGVVFYLLQEGRGAGFLAKARDRMLVQASGNRLTTFDAYREMGLAADQRRYDDVAPLCALLGIGAPLLLLTNNPEKAAALARHGIALAGTRPLRHAVSPFNAHYLAAKARSGHTLGAAAGEEPAAPPVAVTSFAPHALDGDPRLVRMAAYWLPIAVAEDGPHWFRLDAYLDVGAQRERVVLSYGDPAARPALVRVHRETLLDRFPQRDGGGRARWLATVRAFVGHGAGCALLTLADGSADAGVAARGTGAEAGVAPAVAARLLAAHLGAPGAALLADGRDGEAADAVLAAALGRYGVRLAAPRARAGGRVSAPTDAWRAGHRELTARVRALPALLEDGLARPEPPTGLDPARLRRVVVTGVGSSAAHARFLATLLADHLGLRTRVLPLSAFAAGPPADAADDGLIVCSQGLSPNARLALGRPDAWARVILLTAARPPEDRLDDARDARLRGERGARAATPGVGLPADPARVRSRAAALAALEAAGVEVRPFPAGENEDGTLVRVIGPMAGHLAALRLIDVLAAHAGRPPLLDAPARAGLRRALADAPVRLAAAVPAPIPAATTLAFVTTGGYGELVENLRAKVIEGMLRPPPAIWDLLELPHGPFQQLYEADATLLALTRADAPGESGLLERLAAMLVPARHRLLRLAAALPGPLAVLEHEALMNELMLRDIEARRIDQREWRGRGKDAPLYDVGTEALGGGSPAARDRPAGEATAAAAGARIRATRGAPPPLLERLTWPELERAVAAGRRTAVLPLGATEQHGPHLPFATDTWVAEALAARVCAALEDAIQLPALALGCSAEHRAFPGTLDLAPATLEAVVGDVLRALAAHGFARALVFSAHGGNTAPLAAALGRLRAAAAPMALVAFTDLAAVTATLHRIAGEHGVPPGVAGHHAGEVETSMLLALRPDAVRRAALAAGVTTVPADPQTLFYPSLRAHAPAGTVGDPRAADPARAAAYLDAWATLLVAAVRGAKNAP